MRQFFTKFIILITSLAVSLLLIEFLFRAIVVGNSDGHLSKNDRPQFYLLPEDSTDLQDARYSHPKPANTVRISVVGDSFSFGPYLQYDDTFPKRMERWLNLNTKQPKVEVINRGVCGYATKDEVHQVEEAIQDGSDIIILQITLNDPELRPLDLKDGELEAKYHFGKLDTQSGIFSYWRSLGFIAQRVHSESTHESYKRYFHDLFFEEPSWGGFKSSIQKIGEVCRAKNVKLLTVVFPVFSFPLDQSYPFSDIHKKITDLTAELDITSLDLLRTYQGLPNERLQVWPGNDPHPGEVAHRLAAETIYRWLARHSWVPEQVVANRIYKKRADLKYPSVPKSKFLSIDKDGAR